MNILHCIPSLGNGGAERQLSILARAQVLAGSRVHVAYVGDGVHLETLKDSGVELHRIPAKGNHDFTIVSTLWSLFSRERPDVVHTWLPQMDVVGGIIALTRRTPWVLSERSSANAYTSRLKESVLRRQLGRWADAVVANSDAGSALWSGILRRGARTHVVRNTAPLRAIANVQPMSRAKQRRAVNAPVNLWLFSWVASQRRRISISSSTFPRLFARPPKRLSYFVATVLYVRRSNSSPDNRGLVSVSGFLVNVETYGN